MRLNCLLVSLNLLITAFLTLKPDADYFSDLCKTDPVLLQSFVISSQIDSRNKL